MGHKHRPGVVNPVALGRVGRDLPWTQALDVMLVLGVLLWFAIGAPHSTHPGPLAVYSALLAGTIVHRILQLMDGPGG